MNKVCIIGLGYVGLPLALLASMKGYAVVGFDTSAERVRQVQEKTFLATDPFVQSLWGQASIRATTDAAVLRDVDIIVMCVPTPVKDKYVPDLSMVESATQAIAQHLQDGQLIVIESTIYPGTTEEVLKPILDRAGKQYFLAYCPERIDPGNARWTLRTIPRVLGALDDASYTRAAAFYSSVVDASVTRVASIKEAEAVKIMENTFRDINIAFVNEMAMSFDTLGIDIMEVLKGASTKPFAFMAHTPGCGVGGHCIAVDPYYLIDRARREGFYHNFLDLARQVNSRMPAYTVQLLVDELNKQGRALKGMHVGVLGVTYKGNIDDTRESPALEILKLLREKGAVVQVYDPYIPALSTVASMQELVDNAECVVLLSAHRAFKDVEGLLEKNKKIMLVLDGKNFLDKQKIMSFGIRYKGIGC